MTTKKLLAILLLSLALTVQCQVIFGGKTGTANVKTSVLLEFENTGDRGIILPFVRTLPASPTPGTILMNATNPAMAKVSFFNGSWVDLSGKTNDISALLASQPTGIDETTAKVIIGSKTSSADGILVLESENKAMVLPFVNSTDDIPNPSAGMMVYVNKANYKRLAVFNGITWSYWKN